MTLTLEPHLLADHTSRLRWTVLLFPESLVRRNWFYGPEDMSPYEDEYELLTP